RVLGVAWRVGADEPAHPGSEVAVGDVDGDALLAFAGEPVEQQGQIGLLPVRAPPTAEAVEPAERVACHLPCVDEETAEQGALAVIDAATADEAQQVAVPTDHQK